MNVFETLFPSRSRNSARGMAGRGRPSPTRRRQQRVLEPVERLEQRLPLAVVTPFDVRFTANEAGDITFAANTIMTAPGDSAEAQAARDGTGPQNTLNDDYWDMVYVDIDSDPTTFNSSAADLELPADADVLFAGLYWGGRARGQSQFDNWGNVKLRGPSDTGYQDLSATSVSSTTQGAPVFSGARNYQGFKDVTGTVQAQGGGTYTVANVQAYENAKNYSAGWSLVVAYRDPASDPRNLTVFDGFAYVTTSDPDVTIGISGIQAPPAGPVNATLGFVSYEGDLGITGDRAFFDGGLGEVQLSDATNPANNFFNSSISDRGVRVTSKNPDYVNQLGFGADLIAADGLIANAATSGTVRLTTTQDFYYPGVITSAIDLYAPRVDISKAVVDLNGGLVEPGDILRYTIDVSNNPASFDAATGLTVTDVIPTYTTYVDGSATTTQGSVTGSQAAGVAAAIGSLAPGEAATVTFDVTVGSYPSEAVITNLAVASYSGSFFGPFSKSASASIACPPLADLQIVKDDGGGVYVPGRDLTYTLTVANNGPATISGADVSDVIPVGTTWVSGGSYNPVTDTVSFSTGTLTSGSSEVFSFTVFAASSLTGALVNTAVVAPPIGIVDPNPTNNQSTTTSTASRDVDLTLDKLTTSPVVAGQLVTYQVTVANIGDSDVFAAAVTDPFAGVLSGVSWTAVFTDGSGATSGSGDIDELIDLTSGGSAVYTVTGLLASSATGSLINTATVTSPEDTATDTVTDQIVGEASLSIEKTGDLTYKAGGFVNFTVVVTNNGPSFASNVNVFDALPSNVVSWSWTVSYSPGSGPADGSPNSATDSTLPIDKNVDLAALGTATFEISALTVEDQEEDVINDAIASLGEQIVTARWISAYDGPINPTQDVGGLIIGTDDGCDTPPLVRILDPETGDLISEFLAFEPTFRGSVRVASGDLTGDGIAEVVVANGRNRLGEIRVFTPAGVELTEYRTIPFVNGYSGGVEVAVADVDGDGFNDLIAGKSVGQGRVKIFRVDPTLPDPVIDDKYAGFYAYKYPYNAGTMVAGADIGTYVNGVKVSDALDGKAEIISLPNAGKRARVKIVDVTGKPTVVRTLFAFAKEFRGGGTVSVGEYDGDGVLDIFVGMGVGGQSTVDVFSGATGAKLAKITAFSEFAKPTARVFAAALDLDEDGIIDNVYGVQGAAGGGGTDGVLDFDRISDSSGILPNSTFLEPPLRIAPIILRVPG